MRGGNEAAKGANPVTQGGQNGADPAAARGLACVYALPARLDLTTVRALARDLTAMRGHPLILDASGVQTLGGLGLQVLLAAGQHWRRDGRALRLLGASHAFSAALAQFALGPQAIEAPAPDGQMMKEGPAWH